MSQMASTPGRGPIGYTGAAAAEVSSPARQAYHILQFVFVVAPIVAGLDKFFHLLTDWNMYLAPYADRVLHGHGPTFMKIAGVIEIVAGIGILLMPRIFGYVVAVWLWLIIINLFMAKGFYDVALRDFGLSLGALALARLATVYHHGHGPTTMPPAT
jgi:hypothetical protein